MDPPTGTTKIKQKRDQYQDSGFVRAKRSFKMSIFAERLKRATYRLRVGVFFFGCPILGFAEKLEKIRAV